MGWGEIETDDRRIRKIKNFIQTGMKSTDVDLELNFICLVT